MRFLFFLICFPFVLHAQQFQVVDGDTINYLDKDSLKQGTWREFWPNGDLKRETMYKNGVKEGVEILWYDRKSCVDSQFYWRNGKLDGPVVHYSERCKKETSTVYTQGVKNGTALTFYPNGRIRSEGYLQNGKLKGQYKHYTKRGRFLFESTSADAEEPRHITATGSDTVHSPIFRVFRRHPEWKHKLIVCDVTGSMYPYSGQLMLWIQLEMARDTNERSRYVFFNDGDRKKEAEKKIGETGGIYLSESAKEEEVTKKMKDAMMGGGGGDAPENDIEALLAGIKEYKARRIDEVILIADNWAPVKDITLIKSLHKPVHVILCGYSTDSINLDCLYLAWKTKGSVHTIEEDLMDIGDLKEGDTITIGGKTYKINKGKFELLTTD